ncbi:unnamed protein product, partial [Owenia fusiformis]
VSVGNYNLKKHFENFEMKLEIKLFIVLVSAVTVCFGQQYKDWTWSESSPLDDYVNRPDDTYDWTVLNTYRIDTDLDDQEDCTTFVVNMTSQTWLNESYSSQPIWWHHLIIAIPDNVIDYEHGLVFINGGSNRIPDTPPDPDNDFGVNAISLAATEIQAVAALLKQNPNQPVTMPIAPDPTQRRSEDSIIAVTWRYFLETNGTDPDVLLRNPMTKAVMRAFDTITTLTTQHNTRFNIQKFLPAGASKRGWTTWMVACVDRRVFAMAPIVLSVLKFHETVSSHYRAYGGWSFAFGSYWVENITQFLNDPRTQMMADIVDPYSYRSRLTMPKMVVQAAGDEFFRPDEPNFWFNDLIGPKYMWVIENTHHGLTFAEPALFFNIAAFFKATSKNDVLPVFNWTLSQDAANRTGTIDVYTNQQVPVSVSAWYAETADGGPGGEVRRDFRWARASETPGEIEENPVLWSEDVNAVEVIVPDRHFRATFAEPSSGWLGFFLEVVFTNSDGDEMEFTTELNVIPARYPFPACTTPENCWGRIV